MAIFHAHKQVPFYPELPLHGIIIWCFWGEFQKRGQTFWHFFMSCCSMSNKAMKWERLKFIWNSSESFNHFEEISKNTREGSWVDRSHCTTDISALIQLQHSAAHKQCSVVCSATLKWLNPFSHTLDCWNETIFYWNDSLLYQDSYLGSLNSFLLSLWTLSLSWWKLVI